jgi:tetratricopeptide (TPR) repeat protein
MTQGSFASAEYLISAAIEAEQAGNQEEALRLFGEAAQREPHSCDLILWWAVRLMAAGNLEQALQALAEAIELSPDRLDTRIYLARAYQLSGRDAEARNTLTSLASEFPDNSHVRISLIDLELRSGRPNVAATVLDSAPSSFYDDLASQEYAAAVYLQLGKAERAAELFEKAVQGSHIPSETLFEGLALSELRVDRSAPLPIADALSRGRLRYPGNAHLSELCEAVLLKRIARQAWAHFLTPDRVPKPPSIERLRDVSFNVVRLIFQGICTIHEVKTDDHDGVVAAIGRPLKNPYALFNMGFDFDVWFEKHRTLEPFYRTGSAKFQRIALSKSAGALQGKMLCTGELEAISPLDGLMRKATTGFILEYNRKATVPHAGSGAAYLCEGVDRVFVLFSGEDNWPMAWYYPCENLLVRERSFIETERHLIGNIIDLQALIVRNLALCTIYAGATRSLIRSESKHRTALIVGSSDYISTHLFEDLSGFQRCLDDESVWSADEILIVSREYYGRLEDIFPEISHLANIRRCDFTDIEDYNLYIMESNLFPVRVAGGLVDQDVAERVISLARREGYGYEPLQPRPDKGHFPIIFISLRSHGRRWLESSANIAQILNDIYAEYPNLEVIFDGHCRFPVDTLDPDVFSTEQLYFDGIISNLDCRIPVKFILQQPCLVRYILLAFHIVIYQFKEHRLQKRSLYVICRVLS